MPIDLAVVVEIVLAIMFLFVNSRTLPVLGAPEIDSFLFRHHTVSLGSIFPGLQTSLSLFEARGFLLRERAGLHALLNTLFLIGLTLIEYRRRGRLSKSRKRGC